MSLIYADFKSPRTIADPYPLFRQLQDEEPVHWNNSIGGWCLTRYTDVCAAFRDPRFSSDRVRPFIEHHRHIDPESAKPLGDVFSLWAVFNDPPMHTRLRKLLNKGFTPKAIAALREDVGAIVSGLVQSLKERPTQDCDFIAEFCYPLPALVIGHILGVPPEDIPRLKTWSDDIAEFVLVARVSPNKYQRAAASACEMSAYFTELIAKRRAQPGTRVIDDLIAAHEDGDALSLEELVSSCVLLLFAGHETTTHFLANSVWALALHPAQRTALVAGLADPKRLDNALDEMLRWDGPSISMVRVLDRDVSLHGRTMHAKDRAYLFIAAANRDPREFDSPDRFDIARANANHQIAFGHGIHFCIGAHLARLEGAIAFPALLDAYPRLEIAAGEPQWNDSLVIRGMKALPVRLA